MPRRGENIYKRKDGRWEGRYIRGRDGGRIHYGYVYANTYTEVKAKLTTKKAAETISPVPAGESVAASSERSIIYGRNRESCNKSTGEPEVKTLCRVPPSDRASPLFSEVSSEWLLSVKRKVKRSSYVKYSNLIRMYLNPAFSAQKIAEITRADVNALCVKLAAEGGYRQNGLSAKTISDTLSVLRSIFSYTSDEKKLALANISGISVKSDQKTLRVLSNAEQKLLETYLRADLTPCHLGILLCLYTGLRIGELCALTWGDISDTEPFLSVNKTMQRLPVLDREASLHKTEVVISSPKSACSIRKIPLPASIYQLLQLHRKCDAAFLLTGSEKKYIEPRVLENRFHRILKQAGVEPATFHTLRHTFATRCVELGFDIKSLSEILGHASVNITLNRYVHPSMDLKQKNMELLSDLYAVR